MPSSSAAERAGRAEHLKEVLSSTGSGVADRLAALREIKNQIIGSRVKKLLYLRLGAVPDVVAALSPEANSQPDVLVQAAAAAGSFACGVPDGAVAVVAAGGSEFLTQLLSHPDEKVVDASARALRMIYQSKMAPKCDILLKSNMEFILSILNSDNENVTELAATIISVSCKESAEQIALFEAGVMQRLVVLLGGSINQRDASLGSISAIVMGNSEIASKFMHMGSGKAYSSLVTLMQDRLPRTRLLSCVCLTAIRIASPSSFEDTHIDRKLIITILELLEDPGQVGDEAPSALRNLIKNDTKLQKQAILVKAVEKLLKNLDEDSVKPSRMEGILLTLAELCSESEEARLKLSFQVSAPIIEALQHECGAVRAAACTCIKNVTRSLKNLSAGRFSSDTVVAALIQLLYDSSSSVQIASLSAICNLAVNLTPRKSVFVRCGGTSHLIQLCKSMDPVLRLKSLKALRNIMLLLDPNDKDSIIKELTLPTLSSLISDSESLIQEQALGLVRNLIDGCGGSVKHVFSENNVILESVSRQLGSSSSAGAWTQGMYVLTNIAAGNTSDKESVMNILLPHRTDDTSPLFVNSFLLNEDKELQLASVLCILNLVLYEYEGSSSRVRRLQDAAVISHMSTLIKESNASLVCKHRARTVLDNVSMAGMYQH